MSLAIKNTKGTLSNGKEWSFTTKINPVRGIKEAFHLSVFIFIDGVYLTNSVRTYRANDIKNELLKSTTPTYKECLEASLRDVENFLGVEILTNEVKIAV